MALMKCPECNGMVSDKAFSCPHCGYVVNPQPKANRGANGRRTKYHRLPNGFGQIKYLGKNRRRPYGAYLPTYDYHDNGSAKTTKALGYFETYQQAFDCLTEYNKNPFDPNITFEEVYKRFYAEKFNDKLNNFSESTKKGYRNGFNNLSALHNKKIILLRTDDMQKIIDETELSWSALNNMLVVCHGVYEYAMKNDIVKKDYSEYLKIKIERNEEKGVPFSEEEIKKLWENVNFDTVKIALIMIYSGMRISELQTVEIDKANRFMVGGIKTKAGKNRVIPIHESILPFIDLATSVTATPVYRSDFDSMLLMLGINQSVKGTKHTPHDCRHTFSYLADKANMDEVSKHMIMGHSLGSDVEKNTYGHRTTQDLIDAMDLIKVNK